MATKKFAYSVPYKLRPRGDATATGPAGRSTRSGIRWTTSKVVFVAFLTATATLVVFKLATTVLGATRTRQTFLTTDGNFFSAALDATPQGTRATVKKGVGKKGTFQAGGKFLQDDEEIWMPPPLQQVGSVSETWH